MKAIMIHEYGDESVLKYEEVEKPQLGTDEVLIKVKVAAINPVDWKIRDGLGNVFGLKLPVILGCEVSGAIEEVGTDIKDFKQSDDVYAYLDSYQGGYAEYAVVKENGIAKKPGNVDFENAAAIAVGALTAWQALFKTADLQSGQKILIQGAAGGVGSMAVQLAKAKGAYVIGTASGKNEEFVRNLGADEFIDYTKERFEDAVKDVDVVFDTVGGETRERSFQVLKKDGILVTTVGPLPPELAEKFGAKVKFINVHADKEQLAKFSELAAEGKLKTHIETALPFSEIAKAHKLSETGKTRGKIVLKID